MQIELRQGVVLKSEVFQASAEAGSDIFFKIYPDMIRLALGRNFVHFGVLNGEIISAGLGGVKLRQLNYNTAAILGSGGRPWLIHMLT